MEARPERLIIIPESELKALIKDEIGNAISFAFKYNLPSTANHKSERGTLLDFKALMREYYPGIPESTVRQDTASLSRTEVGKRVLFDRTKVEGHLQRKRRSSSTEFDESAEQTFNAHHQRTGGRKAA